MDLKEWMGNLGLALGAGLCLAIVLGALALPLAWARWAAAIGPVWLLWMVISTPDISRPDEIGMTAWAVLGLIFLGGLGMALPRLLRYAGQQPVWVSLGMGLTTVAALALVAAAAAGLASRLIFDPVTGAYDKMAAEAVPYWIVGSVSNGVNFAAPVVLVVACMLAWTSRGK